MAKKYNKSLVLGGLELASAHTLYEDLLEAQKHLVLLNDLHLLYLVIPYDYIFQIKPNFTVYYNIVEYSIKSCVALMLNITFLVHKVE